MEDIKTRGEEIKQRLMMSDLVKRRGRIAQTDFGDTPEMRQIDDTWGKKLQGCCMVKGNGCFQKLYTWVEMRDIPKTTLSASSRVNRTSDGMFRYAGLMLEQLKRKSNRRKVNILQSLSDGLRNMYALALQQLLLEYEELRNTTFLFLCGALKSVTVEEIAYANAVSPGQKFDPEGISFASKDEILRACGLLVEMFRGTTQPLGWIACHAREL
ncbi:hypothetical protein EX30DRAFT_351839 [Ascodesmis nigricans]|uniref:Uncharacterized protein n=1 Tax=Ascodesmis nigricans TaxID=341454 RepID=A0A4S2MKB7_9PEZI|nr:hypothetical protein EX30DRAFT_351839 [Ascodesmis nigricans]